MNHIELFSGCGGLSLGLENAGFELVLANELSPMAAETFAYNFFNEDLEEKANQNQQPENVFWINSKHLNLKPRLRENPFEFPQFDQDGFSDIPQNIDALDGKLIVGSIIELNRLLGSSPELVNQLRTAFGRGGELDSGFRRPTMPIV
ncbi:DNA cytosine methyltransferase [Pseudoalteromonas piscicida]